MVVRVDPGEGAATAPGVPGLVELLERAVLRTVADAQGGGGDDRAPGARGGPGPRGAGEISVALLADADIRRLNREHLGHDRVTDVVAFPLWEEGEPVVGDVYVGLEQARRQAAAEGVPLAEELVRLAVHGTLHVLGWEHPEEASEREASPMYRRQERIVRAVVQTGE